MNGETGNGIVNVEIVNDELIVTFADGTNTNLGSIKGEIGNGIANIELNADSEFVITYTNGDVINLGSVKGDVDLSDYQTKTDESLATDDKSIVGAINELKEQIDSSGGDSDGGMVGTWVFNETITPFSSGETSFSCKFTAYDYYNFGNEYSSFVYNTDRSALIYGRNGPAPEAYYFNTNTWYDEEFRVITITEEPLNETLIAWIKSNATKQSSSSGGSFEMPQIRFANQIGGSSIREENPLKLTVEIIGGGELKVGDTLQLCRMKNYTYRTKDKNGNTIKYLRKKKLCCFVEYTITEEDVDKRFLTVTLTNSNEKENRAINHSSDCLSGRIARRYLRIRRPKGELQSNYSGRTVDANFSNVVPIQWTYTHGSIRII